MFWSRPDQRRKSGARFEDSVYLAERGLWVREEHQTKTTDDRIEGFVFQFKLLGIHDPRADIRQPLMQGYSRGDGEHVRRNVGCQNGAGRSHDACRQETLISGACRNVQDSIARLQFRRFEHAVRCCCEIPLPPLDILLPELSRL